MPSPRDAEPTVAAHDNVGKEQVGNPARKDGQPGRPTSNWLRAGWSPGSERRTTWPAYVELAAHDNVGKGQIGNPARKDGQPVRPTSNWLRTIMWAKGRLVTRLGKTDNLTVLLRKTDNLSVLRRIGCAQVGNPARKDGQPVRPTYVEPSQIKKALGI